MKHLQKKGIAIRYKPMIRYASMLKKGDEVPIDKTKSAHYYKLAAEKGRNSH